LAPSNSGRWQQNIELSYIKINNNLEIIKAKHLIQFKTTKKLRNNKKLLVK